MIQITKKFSLLELYIFEGLRRLYAVSIDVNGNYADFDMLYNKAYKEAENKNKIDIGFENFYCPCTLQNNIINTLLNEAYILNNKEHKLTKNEQTTVKINITLGASPNSSIEGFLSKHPTFKNILIKNPEYVTSILPYLYKDEREKIIKLIKDRS